MPYKVAVKPVALALALDDPAFVASGEIRSLVLVARTLEALPDPEIDPAFIARLEARLMTDGATALRVAVAPVADVSPSKVADPIPRPRAVVIALPRRRFVVRKALVAAVAAATLVALPVAAAARSLPGSPLYGLKTMRERIELVFARGPVADGFVHLAHAARRLDEADQLVVLGRDRLVPATLRRFDSSLRAGAALILTYAAGPAVLERLASALDATTGRLASLLDAASPGVRPVIVSSLESSRELSDRVATFLDAETAIADPAERAAALPQATQAGLGWASPGDVLWSSPKQPSDGGGTGPSRPPKEGFDSHETRAPCIATVYAGPGGDVLSSACDTAEDRP